MTRDTPGTDLPRDVTVLDALIAWRVAHPASLAFRAGEGRTDLVRFSRAGSTAVCWSAQVTRGVGPKRELHTPSGQSLSAEARARVRQTRNAHSRAVLVEGDRLRIGFGALKNAAAHDAVLALSEQLIAGSSQPAESSRYPGTARSCWPARTPSHPAGLPATHGAGDARRPTEEWEPQDRRSMRPVTAAAGTPTIDGEGARFPGRCAPRARRTRPALLL